MIRRRFLLFVTQGFRKVSQVSLIVTSLLMAMTSVRAEEPIPGQVDSISIGDEMALPPTVHIAPAPDNLDIAFQNVSSSREATEVGGGCDCGCNGGCDGGCCTCKEIRAANAAAAKARGYHATFWSTDYSYLFNPCYTSCLYSDALKRRCLGCCGVLDVGGCYFARYHSENNMRGLGLTGVDDDFLLNQTRLYANWELNESLRFYAEYIDAVSFYENNPPRPIEENRSDLLNLFADIRLYQGCCGDLWFRVGRQELIYGDQRLVSPLGWAATRRTFEGANLYWEGQSWSVDAFWTRPVRVNKTHFDSADQSQEFMGIYSTYKDMAGAPLDIYYLRYLEGDGATNFEFDTLGTRWKGKRCCFLWDFEAAVQWGDFGNEDHLAGMLTAGIGREMPGLPGKPSAWLYYDWASGDETIGNGFHHQFPLAHKYLGFMDIFGRRNIEDLNMLVKASVTKKVNLLAWYHIFWLQDGDDVPYNVVMGPSAGAPGGSQNLGQELDLLLTWKFHPRMQMVFGYSHFFSGNFYSSNGTVPFDGDADFFYAWYTWNF